MTLAHSWGCLQGWAGAWVGSDCCPALWCPRLRLRAQDLRFGAETRHPLPSGLGKPLPPPTGYRREVPTWPPTCCMEFRVCVVHVGGKQGQTVDLGSEEPLGNLSGVPASC